MNNRNIIETDNRYAEVANAMVAYMADCRFDQSHLNGGYIWLALEYSLRFHPRFWREFSITTIVDAVSRYFPNWRNILQEAGRTVDDFLNEFEEGIRVNAFDEANAELLLALPASQRPTNSDEAYAVISAMLAEKGTTAELNLGNRDADACGEDALHHLHRFTEAQQGRVAHRVAKYIAHVYRNEVMERFNDRAEPPQSAS